MTAAAMARALLEKNRESNSIAVDKTFGLEARDTNLHIESSNKKTAALVGLPKFLSVQNIAVELFAADTHVIRCRRDNNLFQLYNPRRRNSRRRAMAFVLFASILIRLK